MKTLITGVCSEVGRYLSTQLVDHGHEVVGFDIEYPNAQLTDIKFVQGDVRDFSALAAAAKECDTGIHLAVRAGEASTEDIFSVNVSGAYNFMAAARKHQFRNAIVASSAPVHLVQDQADNDLLLRTSQDDDHVYDMSKALQEVIARDFHTHGTRVMCLRFGHIVWGKQEVNLDKPTPLADFEYCRGGWVALEDVATACVRALETGPDRDMFEILNIVGAKDSRDRFKIECVEQRLGFRFTYDFADFE